MDGGRTIAAGLCLLLATAGCATPMSETLAPVGAALGLTSDGEAGFETLEVTATAYNSLPGQGLGDPTITAWGDKLEPGMQAIAVSRDLLGLGLRHGAEVEIVGLDGVWKVLDKMARRWTRRIDLYMGVDRAAALRWGRRPVTIRWRAKSD